MKRIKSPQQVQRFLSIHDPTANRFHLHRNHRPASDYCAAHARAFTAWVDVAGAPLATGSPGLRESVAEPRQPSWSVPTS